MKKAIKGALLSGLVYPGLGQYVLGKKGLGLALMGLTTAALAVLVVQITQMVTRALNTLGPAIQKGGTDATGLAQSAVASMGTGTWAYQAAGWLFTACWLGGVAHAYWLGKKQESTSLSDI